MEKYLGRSLVAGKRPSSVFEFRRVGGEKAKELAKKTWDGKRQLMEKNLPAKWPKDVVKDDAARCGWLPKDWAIGLKTTGSGLLLRCYVGPSPDDKCFFHEKDIEKYLGRNLASDKPGEKGEKGEMLKEFRIARVHQQAERILAKSNFCPNDYLKCTNQISGSQYMIDRCRRVHGLRVKQAIVTKYVVDEDKHTGGIECAYGMNELRYDLKAGRLELVKTKKKVGKAPVKQIHLSTNGSVKRSRASSPSSGCAKVGRTARGSSH